MERIKELRAKFRSIGYEVRKMKTDIGSGYYIKPLMNYDTVLNWKFAGGSIESLESEYVFTKENYPIAITID